MRLAAGRSGRTSGKAFTLVELLLVVVLVLLLLGAMVFNFSTLTAQTQLDEGATRLETVLRFARAYAASSGTPVQVILEDREDTNSVEVTTAVRVQWEADPVNEPGVFTPLREARPQVEGLGDSILVTELYVVEGDLSELDATIFAADEMAAFEEEVFSEFALQSYPPITFYPDGSSDSAEITLVSREPDDLRRLRLRLTGLTGVVRRVWLDAEGSEIPPEDETLETGEPSATNGPSRSIELQE